METIAAAGDVARDLEPAAVAVFLGAGAVILVAELLGVTRKGKRGDTVSDLLWWVRDRLPRPLRYAYIAGFGAFLAWLFVHIGWDG